MLSSNRYGMNKHLFRLLTYSEDGPAESRRCGFQHMHECAVRPLTPLDRAPGSVSCPPKLMQIGSHCLKHSRVGWDG